MTERYSCKTAGVDIDAADAARNAHAPPDVAAACAPSTPAPGGNRNAWSLNAERRRRCSSMRSLPSGLSRWTRPEAACSSTDARTTFRTVPAEHRR